MNRWLIGSWVLGSGFALLAASDPLDDILRPILGDKIRDRLDIGPVDPELGGGTWAGNMSDGEGGEIIFFPVDRINDGIGFNIVRFPVLPADLPEFNLRSQFKVSHQDFFVNGSAFQLVLPPLTGQVVPLPVVTSLSVEPPVVVEAETAVEPAKIETSAIVNGAFQLQLGATAASGKKYAVEKSADLVTWSEVGHAATEGDALLFRDEHAQDAAQGFYRIRRID